jgi:hypothetical protein
MTTINPRLLILLFLCTALAAGWWSWGRLGRAHTRLLSAADNLTEVERLADLLGADRRAASPQLGGFEAGRIQDVLANAAEVAGFDLDTAAVSIHPAPALGSDISSGGDSTGVEATVRLSRVTRMQFARFLAELQEKYGVTTSSLRLVRDAGGSDVWNVEPVILRTPEQNTRQETQLR